MNKALFSINRNKITVYPNAMWNKVGYLLAIVFSCLCFAFLAAFNLLEIKPMVIMLVTIVVCVFPLFYVGSRRVIMDGDAKTVYYSSWFGTGRTFSFDKIEKVVFINQLSYGANVGGYYRLNLKKNPYGKGIQLSSGHQKTAKPFIDFEQTAIPFIQKLLAAHQPNAETDNRRNAIETAAAGFTMFHQKGERFVSKPIKITNLILAVVLFGLGLSVMIGMVNTNQFKKEYYGLFALIAGIVNIGIWGERVVINPSHKTIEKSYLGWFPKIYPYQYILGFSTLRHLTGFGSNGIDVIIEFKNAGAAQKVTLFSKASSKKVLVLMDELERILAS